MKWIIGLGIFFVLVLMLIAPYNNMVGLKADAEKKASNIEVQQQRRFDLIPQLVGAVKGSMKQEQKVFGDIANARTKYAGAPSGSAEKVEAANQYEGALARLLVVMENYPQLKSIDRIADLQTQIEGTENRISQVRQDYNDSAQAYNLATRTFPNMIFAGIFGFKEMPLFAQKVGADAVPNVEL